MIDINTIINNAIHSAVTSTVDAYLVSTRLDYDQQIAALKQEIEQLKQQRAVSPATGTDAVQSRPTVDLTTDVLTLIKENADVREEMQQLLRSEIEAAVDEAISSHCDDHDHDEYDRVLRFIDEDLPDFDEFVKTEDLPDVDDFVTSGDLSNAVHEAVRETLERVSVSLYLP